MRILLICNKSPWPPREGGPIAMNAIIEGLLNEGHHVKVIAINSYKYNVSINSISEDYRKRTNIELVYTDLKIKPLDAFVNLFTGESYHVKRFINKELSNAIERALNSEVFDVIQFETLFVTPYLPVIRKNSNALVCLRAHNIEHLIWERLYLREKNRLKKWYLGHLYKTLKNYEITTLSKVDGIVAITQNDALYFSHFVPKDHVIAIPFGINQAAMDNSNSLRLAVPGKTIFHIGSMNWLPNSEGITWFLQEVWPQLKKEIPGITLRLAGREMPEWISELSDQQLTVDGEVHDAISYMRENRIMVVPLFSGSGIRIKIIEGMMAGCAVITTTIGAEGIDCKNRQQLIIANSADEFKNAIMELVHNKDLVNQIGKEATKFITENHNNSILIRRLESFYSKLSN